LQIDPKAGEFRCRGRSFKAGEVITIDGSRGEILAGSVKMVEPELTGDFATLMVWADKVRRLKVRANAETPLDAQTARQFGAEGIGLCRTEHMFFDADRIAAVREMILADDEAGRRQALAKILPMQRNDFTQLFTIMAGLPVTIRLLDPPLHEFLPHTDAEIAEVALASGLSGIIATNTTLARDGLRSAQRDQAGGLSGAPLFERSTRVLARLSQLTDGALPLIGVGGISTPEQAYAKIRAGATAVQIYTAMVYEGISLPARLARGLDGLLARDGFASVASAVATARAAWL
jgi:phosphoenolpyruvate synthase/pyruvate phosphate dikinase